MKLTDANKIFSISKRRSLEFVANSIINKEKTTICDLIVRINRNREIYRSREVEHVTSTYTIDGVNIKMTIIYDDNQNSEENLFYFDIGSWPLYPIRRWNNCTGSSILEHIQEYIDSVIIRKKIVI